jgi:hypothetical protein
VGGQDRSPVKQFSVDITQSIETNYIAMHAWLLKPLFLEVAKGRKPGIAQENFLYRGHLPPPGNFRIPGDSEIRFLFAPTDVTK